MTLTLSARLAQGEPDSPADDCSTRASTPPPMHDPPEAEAREEEARLLTITRRNTRMLLELQARAAFELHDRATACATRYADRVAQLVPVQDAWRPTEQAPTVTHA